MPCSDLRSESVRRKIREVIRRQSALRRRRSTPHSIARANTHGSSDVQHETLLKTRPRSNLLLRHVGRLPNIPPPTVSVRHLFYLVCDCFSFAFRPTGCPRCTAGSLGRTRSKRIAHLLCVTRVLRPQHSARKFVVDGVAHRCTTAPNLQALQIISIAPAACSRHLCVRLRSHLSRRSRSSSAGQMRRTRCRRRWSPRARTRARRR